MVFGWLAKRKEAPSIEQVINDYRAFLHSEQVDAEIRDEAELPHSKTAIADAHLRALGVVRDSETADGLLADLLLLAQFQTGVGRDPIHPVPMGREQIEGTPDDDLPAAFIASYERWSSFSALVRSDLKAYGLRVQAVQAARSS